VWEHVIHKGGWVHDQVDTAGQAIPGCLVQTEVRLADITGKNLQVM
jgi:hypothetical protein